MRRKMAQPGRVGRTHAPRHFYGDAKCRLRPGHASAGTRRDRGPEQNSHYRLPRLREPRIASREKLGSKSIASTEMRRSAETILNDKKYTDSKLTSLNACGKFDIYFPK